VASFAFATWTGAQLATWPWAYIAVPAGDEPLFVIVSFLVATVVLDAVVGQIAPAHVVVVAGPVSWQLFGLDG
jgi:hypothetical protein